MTGENILQASFLKHIEFLICICDSANLLILEKLCYNDIQNKYTTRFCSITFKTLFRVGK